MPVKFIQLLTIKHLIMVYIVRFVSTGVIFCVAGSREKALEIVERNKDFFASREYQILEEVVF